MWSDKETSEDLLGFKVHAELLIDIINDETILPVTIGVFGDWGSGKSSILQIIKDEFEKDEYEDSLCIYFNGWTFEGYDDAKAALLNSILKELEDNKKLSAEVKDAVKEKAKKLWKSIDWMRGAGLVMKNIALPAVSAYFSGGLSLLPFAYQKMSEWKIDSSEKLIEKLQSDEGQKLFESLTSKGESRDEKINAVSEFRKDFEELLKETNFKKLVVIIDDLDRCTPDRIIDNLEAVKLFLNVPKTAFLIGADPRIVRHAIELKYKTDKISYNADDKIKNERIISDYLEKLIQIPYNLPKLSDNEVETYLTLLLCKKSFPDKFSTILEKYQNHTKEDRYNVFGFGNIIDILSENEIRDLGENISILASSAKIITYGLKGNPRQIKRFLNTYILREKLKKVAKLDSIKLDVLAKLMVLEYSNIDLFRELHEWQSKSEKNGFSFEIIEIEEFAADLNTEDIVSKYSVNWSKGDVINWLNTEPKLSQVDLRDYYWISRDQLSDSISASSLLSQEIRELRTKLLDYRSEKDLKGIIGNELKSLEEVKLKILLGLIENELQKNPEDERLHLIFIEAISQKILFTVEVYFKLIKQVDHNKIPSHLSSKYKMSLKENQEMQKIIDTLVKNPNTKISKSLKV
jgi:predicted KAP-like P-loop ATPase